MADAAPGCPFCDGPLLDGQIVPVRILAHVDDGPIKELSGRQFDDPHDPAVFIRAGFVWGPPPTKRRQVWRRGRFHIPLRKADFQPDGQADELSPFQRAFVQMMVKTMVREIQAEARRNTAFASCAKAVSESASRAPRPTR